MGAGRLAGAVVTLDKEETEVVRLCLLRAKGELNAQISGTVAYLPVTGMAWHACQHLRDKVDALLNRVNEAQSPSVAIATQEDAR